MGNSTRRHSINDDSLTQDACPNRYRPRPLGLAAIALVGGLTQLPAKASATFEKNWFSDGTGKCLGVLGGNMTNGTPIVQWTCNGNPDQMWIIQTVNPGGIPGGNFTQIQNSQDPSKCLGVLGSATSDGSSLVIWDCNGSGDQNWLFQQAIPASRGVPFGCFNIANGHAFPKVIGILGAATSDGAQAVIWDNLGASHPDQIFCPSPSSCCDPDLPGLCVLGVACKHA